MGSSELNLSVSASHPHPIPPNPLALLASCCRPPLVFLVDTTQAFVSCNSFQLLSSFHCLPSHQLPRLSVAPREGGLCPKPSLHLLSPVQGNLPTWKLGPDSCP